MNTYGLIFISVPVYIAGAFLVAMFIDEYTAADEFEVVICGIFWPITIAFCLFIRWPYKLLVYLYRTFQQKLKRGRWRRVRTKPEFVK